MTSLIAQFRTGLDRLARIVGHVVMRLVLVVLAAGILVSLGSTMTSGDQTASAPAPASAAPVVDVAPPAPEAATSAPRSAPAAATPTAAIELGSVAPGLVAVHSHDVTAATWLALVAAGAKGDPEDPTDDVIYATPQMMLDAVDDLGSR